ncbi:MAG: RidA family protein [Anaerolineae bacterium]|nr:RidA family protein [Anaerolineae bacterium]
MEILQPPGWAKPRGYSNGIAVANGKLVFISGQIGWDESCQFQSEDFVEQAKKALQNIVAILERADGKPEHVTRLTWYVVDKQEYLASGKALGQAYREVMGNHYPAMTALEVKALIEDAARVEIEATAVIPTG